MTSTTTTTRFGTRVGVTLIIASEDPTLRSTTRALARLDELYLLAVVLDADWAFLEPYASSARLDDWQRLNLRWGKDVSPKLLAAVRRRHGSSNCPELSILRSCTAPTPSTVRTNNTPRELLPKPSVLASRSLRCARSNRCSEWVSTRSLLPFFTAAVMRMSVRRLWILGCRCISGCSTKMVFCNCSGPSRRGSLILA